MDWYIYKAHCYAPDIAGNLADDTYPGKFDTASSNCVALSCRMVAAQGSTSFLGPKPHLRLSAAKRRF